MAAPMDYPTETRHQIANDCEQAAQLLETQGWRQHALWSYYSLNKPTYTNGSLCAIGALAVAHNEQRVRTSITSTVDAYVMVGACPAGHAVFDEIEHRAHGTEFEQRTARFGELTSDGRPEDEIDELRATFVAEYNDNEIKSGDEMISLLRDVAAKFRPDESDGGLM